MWLCLKVKRVKERQKASIFLIFHGRGQKIEFVLDLHGLKTKVTVNQHVIVNNTMNETSTHFEL